MIYFPVAGRDKTDATKQADVSADIVTNLMADFEKLSVKPDQESQPTGIPIVTSKTDVMEGEETGNTVTMTTDIEMADRTVTSSEHTAGANISGEEKTQQTVASIEKQDNIKERMNIQTSTSTPSAIDKDTTQEKNKDIEDKMEVASIGHQQKEIGNGDNIESLMETPKSRHVHSMIAGTTTGVQQVFLIG